MGSTNWSKECAAAISSIWTCSSISEAQSLLRSNHNPLTLSNFIGNEFVSSTSTEWIDSFEPKTGKLYARMPSSSAADVDSAVLSSTKAFKSWSRTSRAERSKYMLRIADAIQERRELFAIWESIDQGKTVERARVEVDRAISNFSYVVSSCFHLPFQPFYCTLLEIGF